VSVDQAVRLPAYELLAEDLRAQITSGRLRPGERLPAEPQLCARSGLSRSTVREALRLLASQHLIITTRGVTGGSFVAQPSAVKVADSLTLGMDMLVASGAVGTPDVLEARELIEVPAAAMAAQRRTGEHLIALREAIAAAETDDLDRRLAAHVRFHTTLAAATGNRLIELLATPLYGLALERAAAQATTALAFAQLHEEHVAILRAIEERDPVAAMATCRAHLVTLRPMYAAPVEQTAIQQPAMQQAAVQEAAVQQ
jgi:GntR family transcriptional repressor for pyruvate dehydrogenase complex